MSQSFAQHSAREGGSISHLDPLWSRIRRDASSALEQDPALTQLMQQAVLHYDSFAQAVIGRIARRLSRPALEFDALSLALGQVSGRFRSRSGLHAFVGAFALFQGVSCLAGASVRASSLAQRT